MSDWERVANDLCLIASLISIMSNLMILIITARRKDCTLFSIATMSLSLNNAGFALYLVLSSLKMFLSPGSFKDSIYVLSRFLRSFFYSTSFYTVSLIAIQRYYAIMHPLKYREITKRRQCLCIAVVMLLGVPAALFEFMARFPKFSYEVLMIISAVFGQLAPFLVTLMSTVAMICGYWYHSNQVSTVQAVSQQAIIERQRNLLKMTGIICTGYIITCLPSTVIKITRFELEATLELRYISDALFLLNTLIDVVVHCCLDNHFRTVWKTVFRSVCQQKN